MQYRGIPELSRAEVATIFAAGDDNALIDALLSCALHDPDWRWVQGHCLRLARHPSSAVRSIAGLCFGHLARIHRELDIELVLPVLQELALDPATSGNAQNALDDIAMFLGRPR